MRALVVALGWTVAWFGIVFFFDPGSAEYEAHGLLECMRLVGRSDACVLAQQSINDGWQWLHVYPGLFAIAVGYVAIVVIHELHPARRARRAVGYRAVSHG